MAAYGSGDTSYTAAGGLDGIRRWVDAFYRYMDELPEARIIRAMHPDELSESREKLTCFLSGWLGGPKLYRERFGPITIPGAHGHLAIGVEERDAWMLCMERALDEQPYAEDFKQYVMKQLFIPAEMTRTYCEKVKAFEQSGKANS